jgi:primary-amine oxidase
VVYKAVRDAGHTEEKTIFSSVLLHEPEKQYVLDWKPGIADRAQGGRGAVLQRPLLCGAGEYLDRQGGIVRRAEGAQAPFTTAEEKEVDDAIKHDPRIVDALKKRGITDLNLVYCYATPGGYIA